MLISARSTLTSSTGLKTRNFSTIISELTSCLRIHTECDSRLGGVSLEFTGEFNEEGFSVTECLGGSMELAEEELGLRYQVGCSLRKVYGNWWLMNCLIFYSRRAVILRSEVEL